MRSALCTLLGRRFYRESIAYLYRNSVSYSKIVNVYILFYERLQRTFTDFSFLFLKSWLESSGSDRGRSTLDVVLGPESRDL